MLRTIVSDRIEVIPVLLHSRASFRASTERVTYSEVDGVVEHSIGGIKWDASNKCHIPSVLRDVMASITPAETITGKSERASPPNLDISTSWPFHISLIWKKKKYRQLSVLRTACTIILSFPRIRLSFEWHPRGPEVLPIYSSPQSHRVLPREHKHEACRMRAVCIRDLICITILAYVFCRRSLRRYVGTQQVPYALGGVCTRSAVM